VRRTPNLISLVLVVVLAGLLFGACRAGPDEAGDADASVPALDGSTTSEAPPSTTTTSEPASPPSTVYAPDTIEGRIEADYLAAWDAYAEACATADTSPLEHFYADAALGYREQNVQQLIDEVNSDPRRGDDSSGKPWHKLKLDDIAIGVLQAQRLTIASVPAKGQRVLVRRQPPYFKHGGNLVDLTDVIHPSIVAHCAAACEALQLRVAGLDVVVVDIRQPLEPQRGVVVEINAGPGLWLHLAPWASSPRPVGDAIVASMFPPGDEGRIPVIALVTDGSTDIDAITAALPGRLVGIATGDTIHVAGRQWPITGNPHERAQQLFQYPGIELAVLQTTPDELLEHGFGNDRCEAAVVQVPAGDFMAAVRHSLVPGSAVVGSWDEVKVAGLPVK